MSSTDQSLRQRPSSSGTEKSLDSDQKPKRVERKLDHNRIVEVICAASDRVPAVAPLVRKLAPFIAFGLQIFFATLPYFNQLFVKLNLVWEQAKRYHLEELGEAFVGLIYCFFGGSFMTLIAAVEAFRICGWDRTKKCLEKLYENYLKVKEASDNDDNRDDNNDGIADVDQIEPQNLILRKVRLALVSCDPDEVSSAISGINSGLIAVIATLKVEFAKAITLGASLASVLRSPTEKYLTPILQRLIPKDYHKWINPLINYGCKTIAISIAWFITRIISAFHSAVRGGQMLARGSMHYLAFIGYFPQVDFDKTYVDEVIGAGLAFLGFY